MVQRRSLSTTPTVPGPKSAFKSGRLSKVTRETSANGTRAVRVTYRADGKEKELKDPSWIDKAMDATADALVEVADKAEDVGDAPSRARERRLIRPKTSATPQRKALAKPPIKRKTSTTPRRKALKRSAVRSKKAVKPD